ncbi:MAG: SPOR domain-containing protein [Candidatus Omnitrophota bacterium]|nr:SPOR domain-containing protein [Candidatus Omnitrophota bacterium]
MQKSKFCVIISLSFLIIPSACWAVDMDNIKVDFLEGNYRRVIFECEAQSSQVDNPGSDELNYILGLSYLKEAKLEQAQDCFKRILEGSLDKFKQQAQLGLTDTYLLGGRFQDAEDIYNKLITTGSNTSQKAAILYRLSQLELKKGNNQQANDYLSKLRREFPLSPELRLNKNLVLMDKPEATIIGAGEYSVQVGFFSNSSNANLLRDKLLAKGFLAYIENSSSSYRVKVGRLQTLKEALDLEGRLSKEGFQTKIYP